ncbi:putative clathrin assembly protein At2g25430 [Typha angustifolia]|uniref:putative clathrin assembly protein At2g25430 n=1 Tax=Typha angustifolia TaxID=59011 RepID=UPI003C305AC5
MGSIRKTLGAVKDQTSISIAKVASNNISPELDVAIVKATSHDDQPADEKYLREILQLTSYSRGHVSSCIATVSRRLGKTKDYIVALKALMLVDRLLSDGDPAFQHEILYATRRGTRLLNMSDFRDDAHSNSWDHSAFVRTYALYLDQRLECSLYERKQGKSSPSRTEYGDYREERRPPQTKTPTPLRDMKPERVLGWMHQLQQVLDRFLACRPTGAAKHSRMVLVALYPIIKESFKLYADICEALAVLLDRFFDMEYSECVKAFEAYSSAAKQIDELRSFYGWCKETGVARSSEYPEVQRITEKLLETLEEFMRDRAKRRKSPVREPVPEPVRMEEPVEDMNSIKALPAPDDYREEEKSEPEPEPKLEKVKVEIKKAKPPQPPQQQGDLVDLREVATTADEQGNKLALALFSGPPAAANNTNGNWEAFPSDGEPEVTSAWQTPAAEPGKADWELALVETVSNLAKQKAELGGGFDPLLLNGMYDQGMVKQHVSSQVNGGSSSSVALPGPGRSATPVLALPAPDGSVQTIGGDPFAASLTVPPPSYVQMAEVEKKQQLLVQEQQMWMQYQRDGMQGQASLAKLTNGSNFVPNPAMPLGMPMAYNGTAGYYYQPY